MPTERTATVEESAQKTVLRLLPRFEAFEFPNNLSTLTRSAYVYDLRNFAEYLGSNGFMSLEDLSAQHINDYLYTLSDITATRRLAALRKFFDWAVAEGHAASDPAESIYQKRQ